MSTDVGTVRQWWELHGYLAGKQVAPDLWVCLAQMMFTYRLMLCDKGSVHEFYCYPRERVLIATEAFEKWNGDGEPIPEWVKHHPSMRRNP